MSQSPLPYRPDIDGLRAVAVLGVLFFHLNPSFLSGGFVGVDVFFVISGFLITSIIHRDLAAGKFSLARFYERRIRRIVPALFVVFLATLAAGYFLLLPDEFSALGKSMIYAVGSVSNLHFFQLRTDYYHNEFTQIPLMHTWTLGVEEQFYLLFPCLLLLLHRFFKSTRTWMAAIGVGMAVSLAAAVYYVGHKPEKAFFLLPFRMWELLAGSLLALCRPRATGKVAATISGGAGLALILAGMVFYSGRTPFPGLAALAPCVGAVLVIWSGTGGNSRVARLLSWKPLVGLGLISYSVYLWHWPLIELTKGSRFSGGTFTRVYLLSASLLLGALSWWLVERPFRQARQPQRRVFISWALASLVMIGAGWAVGSRKGFPERYSAETLRFLSYKHVEETGPGSQKTGFNFLKIPQFGKEGEEPSIVLWGDSFAKSLLPLIDDMAKEKGRSGRFFGKGGIAPIVGIVTGAKRDQQEEVLAYTNGILEYIISQPALGTVILEARWGLYTHCGKPGEAPAGDGVADRERLLRQEEFFAERLRSTVARLVGAGRKVVLVYPIPEPGHSVPEYLAGFSMRGEEVPGRVPCTGFRQQEAKVLEVLDSISGLLVTKVEPSLKLLQEDEVTIMVDRQPLYFDGFHLSPPGAFYLRDLFDPVFSDL